MKILQFNVRSYWNLRDPIYNYINKVRPDVVLLNSTGVTNGKRIKHPGYTSRQSPDGAHQGVCILVNHTIKYEFLTGWFTFHSMMAVKLYTLQGPIIIATAYVNPGIGIPMHDFNVLFNHNTIPIFLAGDLNANHTALLHTHNNEHGRQLVAQMNTLRLHFIGPDFDTFYGPRGNKGRPDIFIGNRATLPYHSHVVPGEHKGSDHIPMIITISTNPILHPERPQFMYSRANWEGFQANLNNAHLDEFCQVQGREEHDIDLYWLMILNTIVDEMKKNIPQTSYKIRASFRPSMRTQRLLICLRNRFEQNKQRIQQVQWDLNILRNHVLESFKRDRAEYWTNLVRKAEGLRTNNPQAFWDDIRKLKGTLHQPFDYLMDGNRRVTNDTEILDVLRRHWEAVFQPHPPQVDAEAHSIEINHWIRQNHERISPLPTVDLDILDDRVPLTAPITLPEVKVNISRLKRKAPGASRIGREAMKHLPNSVLTAVVSLYNACLALGYFPTALKHGLIILILKPGKDPTDPSSYRPISLLEILAKIFEGIINTRLRDHLEDNNLLPTNQFGFREHRSTADVTNIMTSFVANNYDRKLKTVVVTKDVQKAFDTVWHAGLKYKICNNFDLPDITIKLLCSFLDDRSCKIMFRGQKSEMIKPAAGDPQGAKLSPTLYIMYIADMPSPVHPGNALTLVYADDCTHITRAQALNTAIRRMNIELDVVARWERRWRIQTNPNKTKALFMYQKKGPGIPDPVYLNDPIPFQPRARLEVKSYITVLGVRYDKGCRFHKHASNQLAQAKHAYSSILRFEKASVNTKRHLYQALVKPHLIFSPLPLSLSAYKWRRSLQVVQSKALRWVNNVKWDDFLSNETVHEMTRNAPALNVLWHCHIGRQFFRLGAWHEDWINKLNDLAYHGPYIRRGIARVLPDVNYAAEIEPQYIVRR